LKDFKLSRIKHNIKLQLLIISAGFLFFYKIFFYSNASFVLQFINEAMVFFTVLFVVLYANDLFLEKKLTPMSLVMNLGILCAVIFLAITFSDSLLPALFGKISDTLKDPDLLFKVISFLYVLFFAAVISQLFLIFKELFFLKQKRRRNVYFNTMVVFFLLASLTTVLNYFPDLSYIKNTFFIISIILIIVNSIKISWIAFITKKEKLSLLLLSVIICALFFVNLFGSSDENSHFQIFSGFSTALGEFYKIMMIYGAIYFAVLFFTTLFHIPTAEAFDRKAQEVSSLQYFSKLITQVLDFNDLAETITDIGKKAGNGDAAWIVWKQDATLKPIAHKNIGYLDAELISDYLFRNRDFSESFSFIENLMKFEKRSQLTEPYSSAIAAPLKTHDEIKGYLIVTKKDDFIFDDEDKSAIDTFSDYASVAFENSHLLEGSIEKERLERELDVAREIQKKIIPAKDPVYEKLSVSSVFIPAFEVGGDYYDFFEIDDDPPAEQAGKFGFIIADVSGKGISAAFIMAEIKGIFESLSKTIESPKEILIKANQILKRTLDRKNFVSAAYGVFDFEKEILTISRAGHCPVLLVRDGKVDNIRPMGIGLGLNYGTEFRTSLEEIEIDLKGNDMIVLYTDGITEAKNAKMEDFGEKNFEEILLKNSDKSADEISNKVIREITLFSKQGTQHDDITLVILKWKQKIKIDGSDGAPDREKTESKNGRIQHIT
jgi:sigma-B regulation protein RsbU (phosphoserine phosphatase)